MATNEILRAQAVLAKSLAAVCLQSGLSLDAVRVQLARRGECTGSPAWLTAARARQRAIYLANTVAGIRQSALARALGLTPAAICIACRAIEQQCDDDPELDALLDAAARAVLGASRRAPSFDNAIARLGRKTFGGVYA